MQLPGSDRNLLEIFFTIVILSLFSNTQVIANTDVYVTRDAEGNPVFSDQPSEKAEKIQVQEIMTIPAEEVPAGNNGPEKKSYQYEKLVITYPLNDSAIRENSGKVTIAVSVSPRLNKGDQIVINMDGKEISRGTASSVNLDNVDRGTHTLSASIVSSESKPLISSNSVSFTLLRHSQ